VLGKEEDVVLEVLERAEPAGLVAFVDNDRFAFSHALIANALAQDLSELRRSTLHRRIAETIDHDDRAGCPDGHAGRHDHSERQVSSLQEIGWETNKRLTTDWNASSPLSVIFSFFNILI
jgi:hypothetical protein